MASQTFIDYLKSQSIEEIAAAMIDLQKEIDALKEEQQARVQTPWKPDRSGKYLTIVYKDVVAGEEVGELSKHPKSCALSWSHALWDVENLKHQIG